MTVTKRLNSVATSKGAVKIVLHELNAFSSLGPDDIHPCVIMEPQAGLAEKYILPFQNSLETHLPHIVMEINWWHNFYKRGSKLSS